MPRRPQAITASTLDLPDFQGTFDPSQYAALRTGWSSALEQDRGTANQATQNLLSFLTSNYSNAFNNGNNTYATAGQAPGMSQGDMQTLMQGQGVDPSSTPLAGEMAARAGADQAFANVWRSGAANEDTAQRNRLNNAQIQNQDVMARINAIGLQGNTGINITEARARSEYEQMVAERNAEIAQQEAMANWQNQNQVQQMNASNANDYNNQVLQTVLGLVGEAEGLNFPSLRALGLAGNAPARPTFVTTEQDPLGWASIAAAQNWDRMWG